MWISAPCRLPPLQGPHGWKRSTIRVFGKRERARAHLHAIETRGTLTHHSHIGEVRQGPFISQIGEDEHYEVWIANLVERSPISFNLPGRPGGWDGAAQGPGSCARGPGGCAVGNHDARRLDRRVVGDRAAARPGPRPSMHPDLDDGASFLPSSKYLFVVVDFSETRGSGVSREVRGVEVHSGCTKSGRE